MFFFLSDASGVVIDCDNFQLDLPDLVPHRRLMKQLHFHSLTVTWLCSYLTKRHQSVVVNGATSHSILVISGVPQGSVLGPLRFLIIIHRWHLYSAPLISKGSKFSLYADDKLLYRAITSPADYTELQHDIDQIYMVGLLLT